MNITVASINYLPDHAGIAIYSSDFPKYLSECGDSVTMVTGYPYYPQWEKRAEDRGRLLSQESCDGVQVLRGYLYVPKRPSALHRMLHEATFCLFALVNFIRAPRADAVVVFTPPFLLGLMALIATRIRGSLLVVNIQDLPLDAALALGMIRKSPFSRFMLALEEWIYRRADLVVTISQSMIRNVREKGIPEARLMLVPNWIDVEANAVSADEGHFIGSHGGPDGRLTVAYAGNLGVKQGVDVLLRLAKRMEAAGSVRFFIIGDGADRARLQGIATELNLGNVVFLPFLEPSRYREMLADVDVVFVAQRSGAGNNFFPSKLLGLMAQQKPLLIAADPDSELAQVVTRGGFGLVSDYEDLASLESNLRRMAADPVLRASMGRNGLASVRSYDRAHVLNAWRDRILSLVRQDSM